MSLKGAAAQTLSILDAGAYVSASGARVELSETLARSLAETRLYTPSALAHLVADRECEKSATSRSAVVIDLVDKTTQEAAQACADDDLVVLNFASARNHGGGFINGAKAQEEDLCRCSGLYPTLLADDVQDYYRVNRMQCSLLYTDHAIYSPWVPWFRVSGRGPLLERPFLTAVITMPAPNAGPLLQKRPDAGPEIVNTFIRRWTHVLAIAADHRHKTVLLGAWGCGAFQNDPLVASQAFVHALQRFDGVFDRILFAIPRKGKRGIRNYDGFADVLGRRC